MNWYSYEKFEEAKEKFLIRIEQQEITNSALPLGEYVKKVKGDKSKQLIIQYALLNSHESFKRLIDDLFITLPGSMGIPSDSLKDIIQELMKIIFLGVELKHINEKTFYHVVALLDYTTTRFDSMFWDTLEGASELNSELIDYLYDKYVKVHCKKVEGYLSWRI